MKNEAEKSEAYIDTTYIICITKPIELLDVMVILQRFLVNNNNVKPWVLYKMHDYIQTLTQHTITLQLNKYSTCYIR